LKSEGEVTSLSGADKREETTKKYWRHFNDEILPDHIIAHQKNLIAPTCNNYNQQLVL
jgi:hypothetical protein